MRGEERVFVREARGDSYVPATKLGSLGKDLGPETLKSCRSELLELETGSRQQRSGVKSDADVPATKLRSIGEDLGPRLGSLGGVGPSEAVVQA